MLSFYQNIVWNWYHQNTNIDNIFVIFSEQLVFLWVSPIRRGFASGFVNYKKWCTRLAAASDKAYQLLVHGRWFFPGTPASSTTKTGRHDIAEILLKVALNTKNQINLMSTNCARLLADLFLFSNKVDLIQGDYANENNLTRSFNFTFGYIDDVPSLNNS